MNIIIISTCVVSCLSTRANYPIRRVLAVAKNIFNLRKCLPRKIRGGVIYKYYDSRKYCANARSLVNAPGLVGEKRILWASIREVGYLRNRFSNLHRRCDSPPEKIKIFFVRPYNYCHYTFQYLVKTAECILKQTRGNGDCDMLSRLIWRNYFCERCCL